ncbi:MAG TPA: dephospho-CoA kinase [Chitinophagaceae bacterium]|nr:dephospho-CoA kinase [Chitinophagaceae bacterium]
MLKIGLTGGIGSGKSTVARIFETLGIPVYYADDAARRIMNTDKELKAVLVKHFGEETYQEDRLNRTYLASVVFNNKEKLDLLNSLTHPATIRDANRWIQEQTSPYIIKEAALLFESGADKFLDQVIGVEAPLELRISRTMERDKITREEVMLRMNRQMNEEEKIKRCDFIVHNDERQMVIPQVLKLHEQFKRSGRFV